MGLKTTIQRIMSCAAARQEDSGKGVQSGAKNGGAEHQDVEPNESRFVPRIQQNLFAADTLAASWANLLFPDDDPAPHAHLVKSVAAVQLDDILEHVAGWSGDSVHFIAAIVNVLVA